MMEFICHHMDMIGSNKPRLCDLDPKKHFKVPAGWGITDTGVVFERCQPDTDCPIWIGHNFLSHEDCDKLIQCAERVGFGSLERLYDKEERSGDRLLGYCKPVTEVLNNRVTQDCFQQRLYANWIPPYGFHAYEWHDHMTTNPCLRINRYSKGDLFGWHLDSQYIGGPNIRSGYSILVYLSDSDAMTTFAQKPLNDPDDLMSILKASTDGAIDNFIEKVGTFSVTPQKGMAVIFSQSLLHRAERVESDALRYVLRTDLVSYAKSLQIQSHLSELRHATVCLFREAQLNEAAGRHDERNNYAYVQYLQMIASHLPDHAATLPLLHDTYDRLSEGEGSPISEDSFYIVSSKIGRLEAEVYPDYDPLDVLKELILYAVLQLTSHVKAATITNLHEYINVVPPISESPDGDSDSDTDVELEDAGKDPDYPCVCSDGTTKTYTRYCSCGLGGGVLSQRKEFTPRHSTFAPFEIEIKPNKTGNSGHAFVCGPGIAFNHASCQCYDCDWERNDYDDVESTKETARVILIDLDYTVHSLECEGDDDSPKTTIELTYTPMVDM